MPYVYVDVDEVLSDMSDDELEEELASRRKRKGAPEKPADPAQTIRSLASLLREHRIDAPQALRDAVWEDGGVIL